MSKAQWMKQHLKKGERYAGLLLGKDGAPDQHVILLPVTASSLTFAEAQDFARENGADLPTRREQSLLFANLKDAFAPDWYWSGEQHAGYADYAWGQDFGDGSQYGLHKDSRCRVVLVRRVAL